MPADHIVTLPDAIKVLAKSVLENQTVVLEIRRTFVVKDALKEAQKAKFCLTKRAKVVWKVRNHSWCPLSIRYVITVHALLCVYRLGLFGKGPWTEVGVLPPICLWFQKALLQGFWNKTVLQQQHLRFGCVVFSSVLWTPFCLHYFPFRRMTSATLGDTSPCLSAREAVEYRF